MKLGALAAGLVAIDCFADIWRSDVHALDRAASVLLGLALVAISIGIFKKKRFAWILGFAVPLFGAFLFIWEVPALVMHEDGFEHPIMYSASILMPIVVAAVSSLYWYQFRFYFSEHERKTA